jgi:hypothetical protein
MSDSQSQAIIFEIVAREEKQLERRDKIVDQLRKMFTDFPMGLDSKHRDIFNVRFSEMKKQVLDIQN